MCSCIPRIIVLNATYTSVSLASSRPTILSEKHNLNHPVRRDVLRLTHCLTAPTARFIAVLALWSYASVISRFEKPVWQSKCNRKLDLSRKSSSGLVSVGADTTGPTPEGENVCTVT